MSREEMARVEVGHTKISPVMARCLSTFFLLVIFCVSLIQQGFGSGIGNAFEVFRLRLDTLFNSGEEKQSFSNLMLKQNNELIKQLGQFEDRLEDASLLRSATLGPSQWFMSAVLQTGNEKAVVGEDGWLFYQEDIRYLTNGPFGETEKWVPFEVASSPVEAILHFAEQLREKNVRLVLLPTPVKPMIYADRLSSAYDPLDPVIGNPAYEGFVAQLREVGLDVFDPTLILQDMKRAGEASFLETDTHWTPLAMEHVAEALADYLVENTEMEIGSQAIYEREEMRVENTGDIAGMLKLPPTQILFPPEKIMLKQVLTTRGELWGSDLQAEVLVLGDSFSNIYSLGTMGWGTSAGFVEQVAYALQQPADAIRQNDAGAYATRERLQMDLLRGKDRLASKKVVVWQFAMRELALGDWKVLDLTLGEPQDSDFLVLEPGQNLRVTAHIAARSASPRPDKVTYRDHVIALHLVDIRSDDGLIEGGQAVVYGLGMKDRELTSLAFVQQGDQLEWHLSSWTDYAGDMSGLNRNELDDFDLQLEEPVWGYLVE